MRDREKSKSQLIEELEALRQEFETTKADVDQRKGTFSRIRDEIWKMESGDDMQSVLAAMWQGLQELGVPLMYCSINLVEDSTDPKGLVTYSMNPEGEWRQRPATEAGATLLLQIWRSRELFYRSDLEREDPYGERLHLGAPLRAVVDVPFLQGTLAVSSLEPDVFSQADLNILQETAKILAEGFGRMEDLRRLGQRNRNLEEKERLLEAYHQMARTILQPLVLDQVLVNLVDQVVRAGIFRSLLIALVDEENRTVTTKQDLTRASSGAYVRSNINVTYDLDSSSDILAEVARAGKMVVIEGWDRERFKTAIDRPDKFADEVSYFVPVKQEERVLAVLAAASRLREKEETLQQIEAMQPLLDQIAIALEHARLYENLQVLNLEQRREKDLREAEAAVRISIAGMHRPEDLLNVIREVSTQLRALGVRHDRCSIQVVNAEGSDFFSCGFEAPARIYGREEVSHLSSLDWDRATSNVEDYPWVTHVWRTGEPRYEPRTTESSNLLLDLSLIDVAFSQGTLAINRDRPNAFNKDDIVLLQHFARIISEGFQRFIDILEHRRAEEDLRQSEERFRVLAAVAPVGIFQSDSEGNCIYMNERCSETTGLAAGEELGSGWMQALHPEDAERVQEAWLRTLQESIPFKEEYRFRKPDGSVVWVIDEKLAIRNRDGEVQGYVGSIIDITERLYLEEEMRKVHNLESLGLLAGGIAHDFNNVLTGIIGNLALLEMSLDADSEECEIAMAALRAADRTRELTQQLLTFAKGGAPVKRTAQIEALVRETTDLSLRGSKTKAEFHFAEDLSSVDMDTGQISQVVQNLVLNADQAMPNGGILKISAKNVEISDRDLLPLAPGSYVEVAVEDQGVGMSKETMAQVFNPYFSTKQAGHGLGLSITYSIISRHGGHIAVNSEIDVGTTFAFYLPVADRQTAAPVAKAGRQLPTGTARILLMDDEELIHEIMSKMLESLGYEVDGVYDGTEAVQTYETSLEAGSPYDVVIMDLTIPGGMGGEEAVAQICQVDPQVRVVVSSGYSNDPVMANYADYGFCGRLAKPVSMAALADTMQRVLAATVGSDA